MSVISATVILTCCIVIGQLPTSVRSTEQPASEERINKRYFLDKLLTEYGDGEHLTVDEVQRLLATLKKCEKDNMTREKEQFRRSTASSDGNEMANVSGTCGTRDDWMDDPHCLDNMCMSAVEIFQFHEVTTGRINASQFREISPTILFTAQTVNCAEEVRHVGRPKPAEVWGYSFICVTFINLCSLMGMVFLPLMHKSFYKKLLMFMVALAVGTLSGSSLLFLIPECFEMASEDNPYFHDYIWRCTTVICGIYLFFIVERVLKNIMDWRKKIIKCDSDDSSLDNLTEVDKMYESLRRESGEPRSLENAPMSSVKTRDIHRNESINMSFSVPQSPKQMSLSKTPSSRKNLVSNPSEKSTLSSKDSAVVFDLGESGFCAGKSCCTPVCRATGSHPTAADNKATTNKEADINNSLTDANTSSAPSFEQLPSNNSSVQLIEKNPSCTEESAELSVSEPPAEIKSVAWMVIFGDGLHNFIDGLSIGAAFSKNILAGVSVSLAVMCEELPHELGDFAILLSSGMSLRQAIGYNFLSACTCYMGLVVGILVGEMTVGSTWIFALAGGMFLYISLVDMLPEVNHASEEETKSTGHVWRVFFLQNAGLLSGYGIILLLAVFSDKINLEQLN